MLIICENKICNNELIDGRSHLSVVKLFIFVCLLFYHYYYLLISIRLYNIFNLGILENYDESC